MSTDAKLKWWRRFLCLLGIETTPGHGWRAHLLPRFFVLILIGLLSAFFGFLGLGAYSTSPSFCKSCHIMQPYYDAWTKSKHNTVACVECHYPPGAPQTILWKKFQAISQVVKYVTRTY